MNKSFFDIYSDFEKMTELKTGSSSAHLLTAAIVSAVEPVADSPRADLTALSGQLAHLIDEIHRRVPGDMFHASEQETAKHVEAIWLRIGALSERIDRTISQRDGPSLGPGYMAFLRGSFLNPGGIIVAIASAYLRFADRLPSREEFDALLEQIIDQNLGGCHVAARVRRLVGSTKRMPLRFQFERMLSRVFAWVGIRAFRFSRKQALAALVVSECAQARGGPLDNRRRFDATLVDALTIERRSSIMATVAAMPSPVTTSPIATRLALKRFVGHVRLFLAARRLLRAGFDRAWYLRVYPDVAATRADPLTHYILHGQAEGRRPYPSKK